MKPEQSSLERMHVKGTPTEDIREWCGFAHKVVELTGPTQNDALELWLHEDSADMLLDMCDDVDERFELLKAENAKLRDLVYSILKCAAEIDVDRGCDVCPMYADGDLDSYRNRTWCKLRPTLREYGFEVKNGY